MTHQQLHTLKDFQDLSTDERFVMLINTLRVEQPTSSSGDVHHVLRDAGKGEGWHACLNRMEELLLPPPPPKKEENKPLPYTSGFDANNRP